MRFRIQTGNTPFDVLNIQVQLALFQEWEELFFGNLTRQVISQAGTGVETMIVLADQEDISFRIQASQRLSRGKAGYARPNNDVVGHFHAPVNSSVISKCSTLRGQCSMHSPQVRQVGSSIYSPVQAWRRTSIRMGQLNEQI